MTNQLTLPVFPETKKRRARKEAAAKRHLVSFGGGRSIYRSFPVSEKPA